MTHVTVRKAQISELSSIQDLALRTISQCYRSFLGSKAVDECIWSGATKKYLEEHLDLCRVLLMDKRIVGIAICKDHLLDLLMVDPAHHRNGLGSRLIQAMEDELFREHECIELESFERNDSANQFYDLMGRESHGLFIDPASGHRRIKHTKSNPRRTCISAD